MSLAYLCHSSLFSIHYIDVLCVNTGAFSLRMAALTTISSLLSTQHLEAARLLKQKATQIIDPAFSQASKQMLTQLPMMEMDEVQGPKTCFAFLWHPRWRPRQLAQWESSYALDCDALLESRPLAHRITVRRAPELGPVGGLGRNVEITLSLSVCRWWKAAPHELVERWEKQYETQYHRLRGGMATSESRLQEVCETWQAERDFSGVQEAWRKWMMPRTN